MVKLVLKDVLWCLSVRYSEHLVMRSPSSAVMANCKVCLVHMHAFLLWECCRFSQSIMLFPGLTQNKSESCLSRICHNSTVHLSMAQMPCSLVPKLGQAYLGIILCVVYYTDNLVHYYQHIFCNLGLCWGFLVAMCWLLLSVAVVTDFCLFADALVLFSI